MASIQNRIEDVQKYFDENPSPEISGTFEIHIFMSPLNPSKEIIDEYNEATNIINKERRETDPNCILIKPCLLALDFRGKGYVTVMQSSRYYYCSNLRDAVAECNREADAYLKIFKERNVPITIIREKLETLASSEGVPVTDESSKKYPKYFEHHIRVKRRDGNTISPITPDELQELNDISEKFTDEFCTPIPISYNKVSELQRYLNARFRNVGSETCKSRVADIINAINKTQNFEWVKTISEYVPYDSYTALDQGWIDF